MADPVDRILHTGHLEDDEQVNGEPEHKHFVYYFRSRSN